MKTFALFVSVMFCAQAFAGEVAATVVIRGGRLFDGTGSAARPIGAIVLEGDRIREILPPGSAIPAAATVIDASDGTVLPGLFDLHVHIAVPGSFGLAAMPKPEANLASHLYCGVTSVLDLHGDEATIFALRDASRTSPSMARLFTVGAAFTVPHGHCTQFGVPANEVTSVADVDARFAALLPKKPDAIKAALEHGKWGGLPEMPTLSAELFQSIGDHAHSAHLPLFSHVWTLDEALTATRGGARALAHGVFIGKASPELIAEMKTRHVAYVPTLSVVIAGLRARAGKPPYAAPLAKEALNPDLYATLNDADALASNATSPMTNFGLDAEPRALANLKAVADAGIEIGAGTDAGNPFVTHGPGLLYELSLYVEAGLTPAQALHAATLSAARILGVDDRFGSIEAGKIADLVVVRGDPTAKIGDLWNVEAVVKAGTVVDRKAMAERTAVKAKPLVARVVGADLPTEIDGFDDGDLESAWGAKWTTWSDHVAPGGKSQCTAVPATVDGEHVLRVKGTVAEGFQWGAWAGVYADVAGEKKFVADASHFTGLKLRVRGTPRPYLITVQCAAVKDYNVFTMALPVSEEWSEVEVPFASLKQIGFGKPVKWTATDVTGVTIDARNTFGKPPVNGDFTLEIDWVRVY
ncbi:MAG: CIA30 family protein [Planctomycetes bacterium]|nr:CIA30 family protein [Planctomycetota bacterium]MBI3846522.1 CIA30 family protein [Planctomycetota bacterium]